MTLGKVNINLCVTSKLPIIKSKLPFNHAISCRQYFTVQCNLFTMHSFLYNLITVTGKNKTMYSKNRIGNTNFYSKLSIFVFQINSISLIESDEFRETLNNVFSCFVPIITETHFTLWFGRESETGSCSCTRVVGKVRN